MSGVSTPCSLNDDEDLSLARLSIRRNTQSFHDAGDPRDWERAPASRNPSEPRATTTRRSTIQAMEQAQLSGAWEDVCAFLRVPFGPLLHTLSYVNGIDLARFETACPPLARTRMCESASKAAVLASVRRLKGGLDLALRLEGQSWKQLTGWIGSPPAWCVLHELFSATDGPGSWEWKEGWAATDVDVSRWFGVSARAGRVVGLNLFGNRLRGFLPDTVGSLTNLRELVLHHNELGGVIPATLGKLRRLETLDLSCNRLEGGIPDALGGCASLEYLNLAQNRLSGALPPALGRMGSLEALHVDHNGFAGRLPRELGDCARLEVVNASHCRLSGRLPAELGRLARLKALFLGHNAFEGGLEALAPLCGPPPRVTLDRGAAALADAPHAEAGALKEVYVNDNRMDVGDPPPRLVAGLNVLFVVRNEPPRPGAREAKGDGT